MDRFGGSVSLSGGIGLAGPSGAGVDGRACQGATCVYALPESLLLHPNRIRLIARVAHRPVPWVVKAVAFTDDGDHAAAPDVTVKSWLA